MAVPLQVVLASVQAASSCVPMRVYLPTSTYFTWVPLIWGLSHVLTYVKQVLTYSLVNLFVAVTAQHSLGHVVLDHRSLHWHCGSVVPDKQLVGGSWAWGILINLLVKLQFRTTHSRVGNTQVTQRDLYSATSSTRWVGLCQAAASFIPAGRNTPWEEPTFSRSAGYTTITSYITKVTQRVRHPELIRLKTTRQTSTLEPPQTSGHQ